MTNATLTRNPIANCGRDENEDEDVPQGFICPLTLEIMEDPLMDRRGMNFERSAIVEWLDRGHNTCPLTRQPISYSSLIPNAALRLRIERWKKERGIPVNNNRKTGLLCIVDSKTQRSLESQLERRYIATLPLAHEMLQNLGQNRPAPRQRRNSLNNALSPASRRRRLATMIDSALSSLRMNSESEV